MSGPYIRAASLGATAVFNVEGGDVAPEDGESPDGSVTVARKASLLLTVEVQGKAAHASNPLEGASAIEAMALKIVRPRPRRTSQRFAASQRAAIHPGRRAGA